LDAAQLAANGIKCHYQMAWMQTDSLTLISMQKKNHKANGMPLSLILPTKRSHYNCRLNIDRLLHCHRCCCCVKCRRYWNHHGQSNCIGML
jgi:hypothetical protein